MVERQGRGAPGRTRCKTSESQWKRPRSPPAQKSWTRPLPDDPWYPDGNGREFTLALSLAQGTFWELLLSYAPGAFAGSLRDCRSAPAIRTVCAGSLLSPPGGSMDCSSIFAQIFTPRQCRRVQLSAAGEFRRPGKIVNDSRDGRRKVFVIKFSPC